VKIVDVRVHPVAVARQYRTLTGPNASPEEVAAARAAASVSYYYVVELEADNGLVGLGEVSDINPRTTLDDGRPMRAALFADRLRSSVIGRDPYDLERLEAEIATPAFPFRAHFAAAVDVALHDLAGKAAGQPLYNMLGGRFHARLPVCWVAYVREVGDMEPEIAEKVAQGFRAFKLKVGGDIALDEARVKMVRELAGEEAHIKLDANGAWSVEEAIANMRRLERYHPAAIETPVPSDDLDAMRRVKAGMATPYMEHAGSPRRALEYLRAGVVDVFKLSAGALGGLHRARKVAAMIGTAGAAAYVGSTVEMGLGTLALGHLAAATAACGWPCDLRGPLLLVDDVLDAPVRYAGGCLELPSGSGIGAGLDSSKVQALAGDLGTTPG
jgi:muconate cycloisomerase